MTEINQQSLQKDSERRRLRSDEIDERAAEAKAILDNPVFKEACGEAYSRSITELLNADIGSLTASTAHATMKAITTVQKQLEQYVTDQKMKHKFNSKSDANG